ncbi:MAG: MFS transporter [Halanaerobiales bacterium]
MSYIISLVRKNKNEKLSYFKALFLGLGFMAISATWSLYNSYVPIFLKKFISSQTLIGFIMTFDNIVAITLQPYFGALSDHTHTRFGSRMPYLLIGIPVAAVFFAVIPFADNFWILVTVLIIMNLAMSLFRSPTIALMPDLTPSRLRSKANGVINLMGGLGAAIAFGPCAIIYKMNPTFPFLLLSLFMLIVLILFMLFLREPERTVQKKRLKFTRVIKDVIRTKKGNVLNVLFAIFFWFFGYSGISAFFTLYGKEFLLINEGDAAWSLMYFSIAFIIFAIPSGILASKFGRKKVIITGIIGLIITFLTLFFLRDILIIRIMLSVGGLFWACVNINSYPIIADSAGEKIGAFTGIYYFFSTIPAILSPIFVGFLIEYISYPMLFINAIVSFALALYFILKTTDTPVIGQDN